MFRIPNNLFYADLVLQDYTFDQSIENLQCIQNFNIQRPLHITVRVFALPDYK
jgi:hypothetical protein